MQRREISGAIRAGALGGGLRPHVLGLAETISGPSWLVFLLISGTAIIAKDDLDIRGPALVWRPWTPEDRATFLAGAEGFHITIGPTTLAGAVGHLPISQDLLDLSRRTIATPLAVDGSLFQTLNTAFSAVHREANSRQPTARAMVESYLRIILLEVYRSEQERTGTTHSPTPSHRIFSEFGSLIERHFRERWTVNDYARTLGVSRDRLGDICQRVRGFGPKELINRRITFEARMLLEESSSSLQQIAALLGFSSAAQFNQYFSRTVGSPPGLYRKAYLDDLSKGLHEPRQSFEWP